MQLQIDVITSNKVNNEKMGAAYKCYKSENDNTKSIWQ
jgi:hypothetical protein